MKLLLLIVALFCFYTVKAQTVIRFIAKEKVTSEPIARLQIQEVYKGKLTQVEMTSSLGEALFTIESLENTSFTFNHLAYHVLDEYDPKKLKKVAQDTFTFSIRLYFNKERLLNEVVIKPIGAPDTVFQSERVSVSDFEFLPSGNILLLTYPKTLKKGSELALFDGQKVVSYIPIDENGQELIRDYRKNVHVVCENKVFGIVEEGQHIQVSNLDKRYFDTYIKPLIDSTQQKLFFSTFNSYFPAFDYYSYQPIDSVYQKICQVKDELMMELYRSEFKYVDTRTKIWAKEKEKETGVDKEIWVGMYYFTSSIYYKELYAPLFMKQDTFYLFDHYKNYMFSFNAAGKALDSIPIFYHLSKRENGWQKQLIQDVENGEIYIYFEKGGRAMLRQFNTHTGELSDAVELYYSYPTHIQVRNNFTYYIYRPYESIQKKFLYRERLPFYH